jgi:alginate O-acetyltransferase complex protein AlgJ
MRTGTLASAAAERATRAPANEGRRARFDRLAILCILGALLAPAADQLLRSDEARGPAPERRLAARWPGRPRTLAGLAEWPAACEHAWRDRLGLRDLLLRSNSLVKLRLFRTSPTPTVALGRDGWMFYTGESSVVIRRGLAPFSAEELRAWCANLSEQRDWLAARGIASLFVIGPNKETVYPERAPPAWNRVGPTRLEQLFAELRREGGFEPFDVAAVLAREKARDREGDHLYTTLGTHWSARGNDAVYRAILAELAKRFPSLEPVPPAEIEVELRPGKDDSFADSMYVGDLLTPAGTYAERRGGMRHRLELSEDRPQRVRVYRGDPRGPSVLVFHDSFAGGLEAWLAEHCSRLELREGYTFDRGRITKVAPDAVLSIYVERVLAHPPPEIVDDEEARVREEFEAASERLFAVEVARERPEVVALGETRLRPLGPEEGGPALEIVTASEADTLALPAFAPDEGSFVCLVEIESPVATSCDLFWQAPGDQDWPRRNRVSIELEAGRSRHWVRIDGQRLSGSMRLRPGREPGRYVLHACELRALR